MRAVVSGSLLSLATLFASGEAFASPPRTALQEGLALNLAAPEPTPWLESGQSEATSGAAPAGPRWLWASILGAGGFAFDVGATTGAALAISAQNSFQRSTGVNVAGAIAGAAGMSLVGGGLGYLLGRSAQAGSKAARATAVVLDALAIIGAVPAGVAFAAASQLGPMAVPVDTPPGIAR